MSSALGESANLNLLPLLGQSLHVQSGPLPMVAGTAPSPFDQTGTLASSQVSTGLTGTLLGTGTLTVHARSAVPGADTAAADATVNNLGLKVTQLLSLLGLDADVVTSTAAISGTCAGGPQAAGTTMLTNPHASGTLGTGLAISSSPAPNTVLLNVAGIRIVLNEQIRTQTSGVLGLTVNAIHVYLEALPLTAVGVLSGDIVVAQSHAEIRCGAVSPAASDLALTNRATPSSIAVGGTVTFNLTIANFGPDMAQQAVLTNSLPAGTTFVSVQPSQGSCSGTATVTCNLGTIANGGQAQVLLVVRADQVGTMVDMAEVTCATLDPGSANNRGSATATVNTGPVDNTAADLAVTLTGAPDPAIVDGMVSYVFQVTNQGPGPATAAHLTSDLPERSEMLSMTSSQGSCGTNAACDLGTIAVNGSVQVNLVLRLRQAGSNILRGVASSSVADPNAANNQAARTITINVTPPDGPGFGKDPSCPIDVVPAATLLYPYFEVDLLHGDGASTLFSVVNAFAAPRLVQVTLWTNWSVPTLTFPVYLSGFDVQTFNLRDLLVGGNTPQTGAATSPKGPLSNDNTSFPGCAAGAVTTLLTPTQRAHLQAWHTGARSALTDNCAASASPDGYAVGYITVDVVRSCSNLSPADAGYFGPNGVAAFDNVLFGDFTFINPGLRSAKGDLAVHIVAEPGAYLPGDYTFYGRYVNGSGADQRRPLGNRYASRYLAGGNFQASTEMLVWRDTKAPATGGLPCGTGPSWLPMSQSGVTVFDEQENALVLANSTARAPMAMQKIAIGAAEMPIPSPFGWVMLDLDHESSLFAGTAQGWVTTLISADGRFSSIGGRAIRLGTACGHF